MRYSIKTFIFVLLLFNLSMARTVHSGYFSVGEDKLFYETAGEGPVIVFIHDGLVHREIWEKQFASFSRNFLVVRYDRRGYGNSSAATGRYLDVEDLYRLFKHLQIDKACLIAMSSGGRMAINFTLQFPEKVSSLVLVGAVVGGFPYTEHFYSRGGHYPSGLRDGKQRVRYYLEDDPYEIYGENTAARAKVRRLLHDNPRKGAHHHYGKNPSTPAYLRLHEIRIPALILVGEFDIPDVHAHAGAINAGIPNSKRDIILKSGHLIPMEQPELFNTAVQKFLTEIYSR